MSSNELTELLRPLALVQKLIWVAITMSIVIYVVIVYVIQAIGDQSVPPGQVQMAFYAMGAVIAIAALIYRQHAFADERLQRISEQPVAARTLAVDSQTRRVDADRLRRIEALEPREQGVLNLARSLLVPMIVVLALNESIALVGLVAAYLAHRPAVMLPFAALALALNLFVFPRLESLPGRFLR